jgi:hypothetical protein
VYSLERVLVGILETTLPDRGSDRAGKTVAITVQ